MLDFTWDGKGTASLLLTKFGKFCTSNLARGCKVVLLAVHGDHFEAKDFDM